MKKIILYAIFTLMSVAASAQYVSVENSWSADRKKLTVTIYNTSDKFLYIVNDITGEASGASYLILRFQKSDGTMLGRRIQDSYGLKRSDRIRMILEIPPNSSIKCDEYNVYFFAQIAVKNTNEIKKIELKHRIYYGIPELNFRDVYTDTVSVSVTDF